MFRNDKGRSGAGLSKCKQLNSRVLPYKKEGHSSMNRDLTIATECNYYIILRRRTKSPFVKGGI